MKFRNMKFIIILIMAVIVIGFLAYEYLARTAISEIEINSADIIVSNESSEVEEVITNVPESVEAEKAPEIKGSTVEDEKGNLKNEKNDDEVDITNKLMSAGYQKASGRKIDTIIIHSSYNSLGGDEYSVDKIVNIYKSYGVSAHYLIDRKGKIYQLVEDKNIAYHAGVAKLPDSRTNVNEVSIGIELVNTKTDKFTEAQYKALNSLLSLLKAEYRIKYVLGHNQVAPERKDDPWNFSWNKIHPIE